MAELSGTAYSHSTLAPDWGCEVLSASTRKIDLHEKRPLVHAREGVLHLWLVDPTDRTLQAFAQRSTRARVGIASTGTDLLNSRFVNLRSSGYRVTLVTV